MDMKHYKYEMKGLMGGCPGEAKPTNKSGLDHAPFPARLHAMLAELEKDPGTQSIVAWRPHGRVFVVEDRSRFVEQILPCWFTMKSFASFQRQLNMYGFRRLSAGPDKGGYYHDQFLRGFADMASRIPRQKLKGKGPRKPACAADEPNFYTMAALRPPNMTTCTQRPVDRPLSLQGLLVDGMSKSMSTTPQLNTPVVSTGMTYQLGGFASPRSSASQFQRAAFDLGGPDIAPTACMSTSRRVSQSTAGSLDCLSSDALDLISFEDGVVDDLEPLPLHDPFIF